MKADIEKRNRIVAAALQELKPGFLPRDIFFAVERLVVWASVEVVPVRKYHGKVQVLMLKRPQDDPFWAGTVHTPGTMIRPTDEAIEVSLNRVFIEELMSLKIKKGPTLVCPYLHDAKRGIHLALVYWVELVGRPQRGRWYDAEHLPQNQMECIKGFNDLAIRAYRKTCLSKQ